MSQPKVDVIIPCYNGESYIERALKSVSMQTLPVNQIIVINDGSADHSLDVLNRLGGEIVNLRVHTQKNMGLSHARNIGAALSKAEYISFLDVDDFWLPDKLANQIKLMQDNHSCLAVFSYFLEDKEGSISKGKKPPRRLALNARNLALQLTFAPGSGSAALLTRNALNLLGTSPFDEKLSYAEDLDCWIRLSKLGKINISRNFDVVITKRPESMQGTMKSNPNPYLSSIFNIVSKERENINRLTLRLHFFYLVFQVIRKKGNWFVDKIDTSILSRYFYVPVNTFIASLYLRLMCLLFLPGYYLYRKVKAFL